MKTAAQELAEAVEDFMFFAGHADGCRRYFTQTEWRATPAGQRGEEYSCQCGYDRLQKALAKYKQESGP